jgi:hypothetical protein
MFSQKHFDVFAHVILVFQLSLVTNYNINKLFRRNSLLYFLLFDNIDVHEMYLFDLSLKLKN